MPDKNLNFAGNLLSSYLLIAFFGILTAIAAPFAFIITLFVPGDLGSLLQGQD